MENSISQIHDKMFKEVFGNHKIAADFLKAYLPECLSKDIDLNSLEVQKGSFITQELKEVFTDLLFKANINGGDGYICFLFEHKSYPDRNTIYQIQKYIIEIWVKAEKENSRKSPPMVIPILIYNGRKRWNYETSINERMDWYSNLSEDQKKFVPAYEYLIVDLS